MTYSIGYIDVGVIPAGAKNIRVSDSSTVAVIGKYTTTTFLTELR